MPIDVIDLRSFYSSSLGEVARRVVHKIVRQRFSNCTGYSILGVGYATPYLEVFREEAVRVLAFMPAEQGVMNWPSSGLSSSALAEITEMPLPNSCIDRALIVHALEINEHPHALLSEIWRILTPGGRVIFVVPCRSGLWARLDRTPFGHGRPFSRGQLGELLRETLFSPGVLGGSALHSAVSAPDVVACGRLCRRDGRKPIVAVGRGFDRRGNQSAIPAGRRAPVNEPHATSPPRQPVLVPEPAGVSSALRLAP